MLVLNRRVGKEVMIGEDILVRVLGFDEGCVRLGFDAPESVSVHRKEIFDRIQSEGLAIVNPKHATKIFVKKSFAKPMPFAHQ